VGTSRPTTTLAASFSSTQRTAAPSSSILARDAVASPIPSRYFPDRALVVEQHHHRAFVANGQVTAPVAIEIGDGKQPRI